MRLQAVISFLSSGLLLIVSGCGSSSDLPLQLDLQRLNDIHSNDTQVNGINLNGINLNGINLNGINLNGINLNGINLNGTKTVQPSRSLDIGKIDLSSMTLAGKRLEDAKIRESTLKAELDDRELSGADLIGARLSGNLLNGTSIPLQIDDVKTDDSGVTLYSVAILSDSGPMPLCGLANGVPVPAIAIAGYWDRAASYVDESDAFTFGCINAAVGKCVLWGYKPWSSVQECRNNSCKTRRLRDWHRACVRLVRADYCGDGIAHTRSGTRINVYDQLGLQKTSSPGWEIEAEWGVNGASCINHTRWLASDSSIAESDVAYISHFCPERLTATKPQQCATDKTTYNTQFGFNKSSDERPLVRNESPQYQ